MRIAIVDPSGVLLAAFVCSLPAGLLRTNASASTPASTFASTFASAFASAFAFAPAFASAALATAPAFTAVLRLLALRIPSRRAFRAPSRRAVGRWR